MSAEPSYQLDAYLQELEVEVTAIHQQGERSYALLSDSVLYPEGGGQPADRGRLATAKIVDVQKSPEGTRHFFDGELEPGKAKLELNWPRRYDHMQQHSAQHLLTAVAADRFGWPTTSFHLNAEICDIEIATDKLTARDLEELEEAVAAEIRAARPIATRYVEPAEMSTLAVRSRGLPEGHRGDVRLVEIEGIDLAACGGTHVRTTAEIESLKLLGTESLRGGLRLTWVAGARVRRRLGDHEARAAGLRKVLGAADDEIVDIAGAKLSQLKELGRANRQLLSQVATLTAARLAASPDRLVEQHFDDVDLGFLGQVARAICPEESEKVAFLTGQNSRGAYLLVAAGGQSEVDAQDIGRQAMEKLEGRGGGSGRLFQGRAGSMASRAEALAILERKI